MIMYICMYVKDIHKPYAEMCICTYPLPHFWHHICGHLWCEDISEVLLLFQNPVNLSDLSVTMVAASTVSSQLDSLCLWLLTCLFVSLFQGLMLPPNHILSILLSHQCTIKNIYRLHSCNIKTLYYTKLIPTELFGSCAVSSILAHQSTQFHKSPRHTLFQSALSGLLWSLGVTVQQFCRKSQVQVLSFGTFPCCNMSM